MVETPVSVVACRREMATQMKPAGISEEVGEVFIIQENPTNWIVSLTPDGPPLTGKYGLVRKVLPSCFVRARGMILFPSAA